ncbi:hypothetical protein CDAR_228771 [Caerostris darwini]|uniref:Uncharacterized protein n=1 Tax=Caerostris darwini TaxID=1538125 RepID=A0AAV4PGP1_9ARAC|nr:hypothetical protein CDAR_228771 [Caerostris darwini]
MSIIKTICFVVNGAFSLRWLWFIHLQAPVVLYASSSSLFLQYGVYYKNSFCRKRMRGVYTPAALSELNHSLQQYNPLGSEVGLYLETGVQYHNIHSSQWRVACVKQKESKTRK